MTGSLLGLQVLLPSEVGGSSNLSPSLCCGAADPGEIQFDIVGDELRFLDAECSLRNGQHLLLRIVNQGNHTLATLCFEATSQKQRTQHSQPSIESTCSNQQRIKRDTRLNELAVVAHHI